MLKYLFMFLLVHIIGEIKTETIFIKGIGYL